jgi:hypothetical protein
MSIDVSEEHLTYSSILDGNGGDTFLPNVGELMPSCKGFTSHMILLFIVKDLRT